MVPTQPLIQLSAYAVLRRTFSRAVFESDLGLFRLTVNKGTHFVSMGHTLRGQIYLYPEEALYLVDRGSLLVEHHGLDMTVQEMWSVYFTCAHVSYQDQDSQCAHEQDSTLAMDRYLVYAYLKRLGFVVIRPGTYTREFDAQERRQTSTTQSSALLRPSHNASFFSVLSSWFLKAWRNATGAIVSRIGMLLRPFDRVWTRTIRGPLVAHGDQMNYGETPPSLMRCFYFLLLGWTLSIRFCSPIHSNRRSNSAKTADHTWYSTRTTCP